MKSKQQVVWPGLQLLRSCVTHTAYSELTVQLAQIGSTFFEEQLSGFYVNT